MPSGVAKNENKSQKFLRQESEKKKKERERPRESKIVSDLGNGNPSRKTAKAEAN